MSALNADQIAELLKTPQSTGRGGSRTKTDNTEDRQINVWFKLNHHLCMSDCEHRAQSPTTKACWNPQCVDTRSPDDRGTNIVAKVHDQYICRYCFLDGYLKLTTDPDTNTQ